MSLAPDRIRRLNRVIVVWEAGKQHSDWISQQLPDLLPGLPDKTALNVISDCTSYRDRNFLLALGIRCIKEDDPDFYPGKYDLCDIDLNTRFGNGVLFCVMNTEKSQQARQEPNRPKPAAAVKPKEEQVRELPKSAAPEKPRREPSPSGKSPMATPGQVDAGYQLALAELRKGTARAEVERQLIAGGWAYPAAAAIVADTADILARRPASSRSVNWAAWSGIALGLLLIVVGLGAFVVLHPAVVYGQPIQPELVGYLAPGGAVLVGLLAMLRGVLRLAPGR